MTNVIPRILIATILWLAASAAHACNVPVFRYALERWQADAPEIIVFHRDDLTEQDQDAIERVRAAAESNSGMPKFDVLVRNVNDKLEPDLGDYWQSAGEDVVVPHLLVHHRTAGIVFWEGPLAKFDPEQSIRSPVLKSLVQRTLAGDSVTWVFMRGSNAEQAAKAHEIVESELKRLQGAVVLPEGIGEPGSEVFSEVPMKVAFSMLEFDAADPKETFLAQLLTRLAPEAVAEGESLVVPVFGRGRALEVLASDLIEPTLVEEITSFLCGACSCTVKEINPGFDLPLLVDWDEALFKEAIPAEISQPVANAEDSPPPAAIEIAPGKLRGQASEPVSTLTSTSSTSEPTRRIQRTAHGKVQRVHEADSRYLRFSLVALLGLVAIVIVGERLGRGPSSQNSSDEQ